MIHFKIILFLFVFLNYVSSKESLKTTLDDQTEIEVTVYKNNLGLIKDRRQIKIKSGENELMFIDVASSIIPETVHVKSTDYPDDFTVLEQNYEYDLLNENKLLDKYIGEKIKIININEYKDRKEVIPAILLSNNEGQIYKINDEIYLGYPGVKVLPEIPENLITNPTLVWLIKTNAERNYNIEVSYLTSNIDWEMDYILVVDKDDKIADLSGWVTVKNRSGTTYKNANLKLVAGEVSSIKKEKDAIAVPLMYEARGEKKEQFKEEEFFEYHIYNLNRKTTLKNNQTKQISLIDVNKIQISKEYLIEEQNLYFTSRFPQKTNKIPVYVYINFKNSKENKLGIPLPAGIIRIYKKDNDGMQQFAGEDRINHTPKDEYIKLKTGTAFDITAEKIQSDYKQISTQLYETEWKITIRNHKKEKIRLGVQEKLYGNWNIIYTNYDYEKIDAFRINFKIDVPPNEERVLKYRVSVGL